MEDLHPGDVEVVVGDRAVEWSVKLGSLSFNVPEFFVQAVIGIENLGRRMKAEVGTEVVTLHVYTYKDKGPHATDVPVSVTLIRQPDGTVALRMPNPVDQQGDYLFFIHPDDVESIANELMKAPC